MYRIYCDGRLIYDSTQADVNPILNGSVSLEDNRSSTLKFTLLKDHPDLSYMTRMAATIRLYGEETEPIFVGRIVNDVTDFNGNRVFTCEGELSFLVDSIQRPFDFGDSPENYFKYFINQHNLQVDADRQFIAGTVTVTDPNNYISRSNSFYESTWENIQSRLINPLGGHLVASHGETGTTLNWLAEYPDRTTQEIRFGENLLGVQKKLDSAQIATAIIPLGASYTDSNDQEHRLTIEEVNDGEDYIYNQEAVDQYGWIFKVVTWDDVTIAANLLTKAQAYLEDAVKSIASIELTAADLSALDHDIKEFRLGDMVHIVSEPHGIDDEYLLTKQTIDLLHPEANTITLGYTYRTFTGNAANIGKTAAAARGIALAQSARVDAVHERAVDAQEVAAQALPKFGECRSTAGTQAKINYQTISGFVLEPGATVALLMKYKNSVNHPTLNINGTGAKPIVIADGTALTADNSAVIGWDDDSLVQFVYDGTNWRIDDCAALTRIQHILTDNIVGTNGWINLKDGKFNFGSGKLVWDVPSGGSTPTLTVTGDIVGSTITGGTINGTDINGETININGLGNVTNGTSTYNKYHTYLTTEGYSDASVTPSRQYKGWRLSSEILDSSSMFVTGGHITIDPLNNTTVFGEKGVLIGVRHSNNVFQTYLDITKEKSEFYNAVETSSTITAGNDYIRSDIHVTAKNISGSVGLLASTNRGLYDFKRSDWLVYYDVANSRTTVTGTPHILGAMTTSSTITSGGAVQVGDKRSWADANSGVYITPQGYISMRAQDGNSPGIFVTAYGSSTTTYDAGFYYNATNTRWQSNKQIYAPSFYATGRIDVGTTSVTGASTIHAITQGREIELITQASGTCGIYDITNSKWLVSISSAGVRGPVATTTEVGFMSVADKTKLDGVATGAGRLRRVSVTSSSFTAAASGAGNVTLTPTIPSGYSLVGVVLSTTNNTNVGIVRTGSASGNTAVEVRYKNFATTQQTGVTITVSVLLSNGVDLA